MHALNVHSQIQTFKIALLNVKSDHMHTKTTGDTLELLFNILKIKSILMVI